MTASGAPSRNGRRDLTTLKRQLAKLQDRVTELEGQVREHEAVMKRIRARRFSPGMDEADHRQALFGGHREKSERR